MQQIRNPLFLIEEIIVITRCAVVVHLLAMSAIIGFATSVGAQHDYPNRPVRLVSGYAPGGTTSLVGRLIGQKLAESWGTSSYSKTALAVAP